MRLRSGHLRPDVVMTKAWLVVALLSACTTDPTLMGDDRGGGDDGGGGGGGGNGNSVDPLDVAKSGSRVKMKVLTSGDGAKILQGWSDTMRNEDCAWQVASDGMTRCLPTSVAWSTASYFADPSCTTLVGYSFKGCTPPAYISVPSATSCPNTGPTIYQRGAAVTTAYVKSGAQCTATTLGQTYDLWAVGAVVQPSSFQSATVAVE